MSVHLIHVVRITGHSTASGTAGTTTTTTSSSASTSTYSSAKSNKSHHPKQLPHERLFLRFNNDNTLDMTVTDMIHVYQGKLHRSFVEVSDDDKPDSNSSKHDEDVPKTLENVIREALTSLNGDSERKADAIVGEIRAAEAAGKWILSIKKRRGESTKELIRLAEIMLDETPNPNIAESLSSFLEVCIRERNEREEQLARESRLRESEMEKSRMYCAELLSKANEREQITNELTKRFLAILNTKKERIHKLMEQIQELEAGATEARDESSKQLEARTDEDNAGKNEKPKKPRGRAAATKAKNSEKDEAQAKVVAAKARRIAESTELKKPKRARIEEEEEEENAEVKPKQSELPNKASATGGQSKQLHRVNTRSSTKHNSNGGATQESSEKSSAATTTKSKSSNGPITEDEFGPLPPGWEVTTSRTTGKRCYQNKTLGKKQYARPTAPTVQHAAPQTIQEGSSKKKKHTVVDDDEDGNATSKILLNFL